MAIGTAFVIYAVHIFIIPKRPTDKLPNDAPINIKLLSINNGCNRNFQKFILNNITKYNINLYNILNKIILLLLNYIKNFYN